MKDKNKAPDKVWIEKLISTYQLNLEKKNESDIEYIRVDKVEKLLKKAYKEGCEHGSKCTR